MCRTPGLIYRCAGHLPGINSCSFNKYNKLTGCGDNRGQHLYGQSYLCVTLDAENLDTVANVLRGDTLWLFGSSTAGVSMGKLPNVKGLIAGDARGALLLLDRCCRTASASRRCQALLPYGRRSWHVYHLHSMSPCMQACRQRSRASPSRRWAARRSCCLAWRPRTQSTLSTCMRSSSSPCWEQACLYWSGHACI